MVNWLVLVILVLGAVAGALLIWTVRGRRRALRDRTREEDALKFLFDCEYHHRPASVAAIAGALGLAQDATVALLVQLEGAGLVMTAADGWTLTPEGRARGSRVVRAHRLWERHLADRTGWMAQDWHRQSERREHQMTPDEVDSLAAALEYPRFDPHGDPIPTAEGKMPSPSRHLTLTQLPAATPAQVVHVEDEPAILYTELVDQGVYVGMLIDDVTVIDGCVRVQSGGTTVDLSPAAAGNVNVTPIISSEPVAPKHLHLSDLKPGEVGRVQGLAPQCYGAARRRMLDLGILPGTLIRVEMVSPGGDPTAYRIRGALIGLRQEQAALIEMTRVAELDEADAQKLGAVG